MTIELALPFAGRSIVRNSPADRVPSHGTTRFASAHAIDFVPVGGDQCRSSPPSAVQYSSEPRRRTRCVRRRGSSGHPWFGGAPVAQSSKASGEGQEQTRLRSPKAPSIRETGGQYLSAASTPTGKTAVARS